MSKVRQTAQQQKYRDFERKSKMLSTLILAVGLIVLISVFICFGYTEESIIPFLISLGFLAGWFAVLCVIVSRLNIQRIKLYEAAYGKEAETVHTGLFGELWEEYEWKQFEGLIDGRITFSEAHNGIIELEITRHKHDFHITVDRDAVYMVMDEETDDPLEKVILLSELTELAQVFSAIQDFVESV